MLVIGFSGVHSAGKTSLIDAVYNELKCKGYRVVKVEEGIRDYIKKDQQFTYETQMKIMMHQNVKEASIFNTKDYNTNEIYLMDRTMIDTVAYSEVLGFDDLVDVGKALIDLFIYRYDLIYLLEPVKFEADGYRVDDESVKKTLNKNQEEFRRELHTKMEELIEDVAVNCKTLQSSKSLEERKKIVVSDILDMIEGMNNGYI